MDSRRDFIKKAAFLSGAFGVSGLSGLLTESIQRAHAIEPEPGSTFWDAEHVIILMQENRSFDHAYGTLRGVRGFNDPRAITLPNGNPVWVQTNKTGKSYTPFRFDIRETNSTWMGCLPHNWTDQVDARNHGRYDRWLHVKQSDEPKYADLPLTLGYYNRQDIPFYYDLADAFTICDQNFCSSLTGTTPNRLHLWTGTIRAEQSPESRAHLLNSDADHASNVQWTTFPERLEDASISWKIYQNELSIGTGLNSEEEPWLSNFGDNPIEYFRQFQVRLAANHRSHLAATKSAPGPWTEERFQQLSARDKALHQKAFCTNYGDPDYRRLTTLTYQDGDATRNVQIPKGDLLHQFRRDVEGGTLPTVSWVVPPERFSDHPCSAWYGAWYIAELLDILTQNPDVWRKTIFILAYDENDGYFDHVPPFVAPNPRDAATGKVSTDIDASLEYVELQHELRYKPAHEARESPIGLGYRVPLLIASPWSRGGVVCSQVFDHTSPLQFLEKFLSKKTGTEIKEPNINQWRRTVCGDLTSTFQVANDLGAPTQLTFPPRDAFIEQIHRAQYKQLPIGYHALTEDELDVIRNSPADSPWLPHQEPGVRRSTPLPYELFVDATHGVAPGQIQIRMAASRDRLGSLAWGAPFMVYAKHGPDDIRVRNYAVSAGDELTDSWLVDDFSGGSYELSVYGPNGFYRNFRGTLDDPLLEVKLRNVTSQENNNMLTGDLELHVVNRSDRRDYSLDVTDRSYGNKQQRLRVPAKGTVVVSVPAAASHGWYDTQLRVDGFNDYVWQFSGRVETGEWSYSDPAMS